MHLYSTDESSPFRTLENKKNYIEEPRKRSMKVAVQQQDLQLLAKTLQEQLLAEVPSGEVFQVKCAINNGELMVLTQHPAGLKVDTQLVFQLLEEAIQSLPTQWEYQVRCFLRVSGEKLPYAKHSVTLNQMAGVGSSDAYASVREPDLRTYTETTLPNENLAGVRLIFPSLDDSISEPSSSLLISETEDQEPFYPLASSLGETEDEEPFDPMAGSQDLRSSKRSLPIKQILLGLASVGIVVLCGGAYLMSLPCAISECKQIQTAEKLKTESRQMMRRAKSEKELVVVQQQLEAASSGLAIIPFWSSHYDQGEELKASLSGQSEKIDQVVKALQAASLAGKKTQTNVNSLEELQALQKLWRRAITPLEAIRPNSELYALAQVKLLSYRRNLQTVNQQLLVAEKWLKKLSAAQAVASAAAQQETTVKSLKDLQKVQSTWQVAVNALNTIPKTSSEYQEAQKLLVDYKPKLAAARDRATKEQLAAKTYQQAVTTANQAKVYEAKQQWQPAVGQWEQALQAAKQVSNNSFYYLQAQSLVEPYSAALKQAQEKLQVANSLQQTRTDLTKTCINGIRICTFTIASKGIIVQLTPEYDQARQSTLPKSNPPESSIMAGVNQHLQILQQALAVISDNAQMPLFVYDAQGRPVYTRSLEG